MNRAQDLNAALDRIDDRLATMLDLSPETKWPADLPPPEEERLNADQQRELGYKLAQYYQVKP